MLHCPCRREETAKRVSSSVDVAILSRPVFNLGVIAFLYTYLNKLYLRIFYCSKIYTGCLKRVLRKLIIVEILHHHLSCELILQLKNVYLEDSTFFIMTPNQPNFGVTITLTDKIQSVSKKTHFKEMCDFNPKKVTIGSGVDQNKKLPSFWPIGQKNDLFQWNSLTT